MRAQIPFFAAALFAVLVSFPSHAIAEVTGGPGYARYGGALPLDDDFSSNSLESRYVVSGGGSQPTGSVVQEEGVLKVSAGPTLSDDKREVAIPRYFFGDQSFTLKVDAAIGSESAALGVAGLAIVNPLYPDDSFTLVGLAKTFTPFPENSWAFSNMGGLVATQPFSFAAGTFHSLLLDYDAATHTMIVSVPDAGFSYLSVLSTYTSGFQILLVSETSTSGGEVGLSNAVFDNLESSLTATPYLVSPTILSLDGASFGDPFPSDLLGGHPVYYASLLPVPSLARVTVNDTWLQLDGGASLNGFLATIAGRHVTIYAPVNGATLISYIPGLVVNAAANDVLIAKGFGQDYTWNLNPPPPPIPTSCGMNCGSGGCSVPTASASGNDNVNLVSGNLYHLNRVEPSTPFMSGPQLHYNANTGVGPLGAGWTHSAMSRVTWNETGPKLMTGTGREIQLADDGTGRYLVRDGCCSENFLGASFDLNANLIVEERGGLFSRYDVQGTLREKHDLHGKTWAYSYGDNGRLASYADPYGRWYGFAYNADGHLTSVTDLLGNRTTFEYTGNQLTQVTDARGSVESYVYGSNGMLAVMTDKAGHQWGYQYDERNRVVQVTDDTGHVKQINYVADYHAQVIDRRGATWSYYMDSLLGVITGTSDPLGRTRAEYYTSAGDAWAKRDAAGYFTYLTYDAFHNVLTETDANSGVKTMTYNSLGQVLTEQDPNGNLITHTYNGAGDEVTTTDALGNGTTRVFDSEGNKTQETNRAGETTLYQYTNGVLTTEANGAGDTIQYEVDALGRTTAVIDGEGYRTQTFLDALGNETAKIFPDGFSVSTTRDGLGRPLADSAPSEPNQAVQLRQYDHEGQVVTTTTFLGYSAVNTFDAEGNQTNELSPEGRPRLFSYDVAGQNVLTVDGDGVQQYAQYDPRGMYSKTTDANNANTVFTYDSLGRLTRLAIDDYASETVFDSNGNRITETVNGRTTLTRYDALNRVTSSTDPMGNTSRTVYDAEGRTVQKIDPIGRVTSYTFDGAGRMKTQTNPDGGVVFWEYDARGLKTAETDPEGHRTEFGFDSRGRLFDRIDPLGGHWKREYDNASHVVAEENPLGERTLFGFDADGRMISKTDPLGRVTQYEWDADRNQTAIIEPDGTRRLKTYTIKNDVDTEQAVDGDPTTTVRYVRDVAGKLTQYVDENGDSRYYSYNLKGELVGITDALGNTINFTRNVDGLVTYKAYSGAGTVEYSFDQNLRLTRKILAAPAATEQSDFSYDGANQLESRSYTLASPPEIGASGAYQYGHDLSGRESAYIDQAGEGVEYTWDKDGNRTAVGMPATNYLVTTEYDANHRPVRMVDGSTGESWFFNYDAANRRTSVVYPDGSAVFTSYDLAGQITEERAISVTGQGLFLEQSTFDLRGNITRTATQDEARQYGYNARDWLVSMIVTTNRGERYFQTLDYDAAGNLIRQEIRNPAGSKLPFNEVFPSQDGTPALTDNIVITYRYNPADQLIRETGILDSGKVYTADYRWDGAGNMVSKIVIDFNGRVHYNQMSWSAENRLLKQQGEVNFLNPSLVEGDGKDQNTWALDRTALNGTYRSYTYDHLSRHVIQEGSATNPDARYIVGPQRDELLGAQLKTGQGLVKMYAYGNHRHDVLSVQAGNAMFTTNRRYLPTGVAISDPQTVSKGMPPGVPLPPQVPSNMPATPLAYGWQGKAHFQGFTDFNNRWFGSPRFISKDPLEIDNISANDKTAYVFAANSSLVHTDIEGLYVTLGTCSGRFSSDRTPISSAIKAAMFHHVMPAVKGTNCIGNTKNLRKQMRNKYDTMSIGCNLSVSSTWCLDACACAQVPGSTMTLFPNVIDQFDCKGTPGGLIDRFAQIILHEMVHLVGRSSQCTAYTCVYGCSVNNPTFGSRNYLRSSASKSWVLDLCKKEAGGDPHCI